MFAIVLELCYECEDGVVAVYDCEEFSKADCTREKYVAAGHVQTRQGR
jgi:hypothetical protein